MSAYERTNPDAPDCFDTLTDRVPSREERILAELEATK